ncbi:hypothetical protein [Psychroflexus sp. MES1-P1E]|uniref:hypothetical protein n=1 Tax=Psychroflexus sp. MES1-P1E TaxID=2058320 RepID=UPI001C60FE22|nr:hypothetical protein [Psychroflexus sp. MES1-P1E]
MEGFEWRCFNSLISDARNINIGTELENTIAIVTFHNEFNNFYDNPEQCSSISNGPVVA